MSYKQKHPDNVYLGFDPFGGDTDVEMTHQKRKLVKTRKDHECYTCYAGDEQHLIPKGSKCYFESGFSCYGPTNLYLCLKCYDKILEEWE